MEVNIKPIVREYSYDWIPVSERIPTHEDGIIVVYSSSYGIIVTSSDYIERLNVTHWLSLPPVPPKV